MFTVVFSAEAVTDYETAMRADTGRYRRYFWSMLEGGIYLPPSQFETCFLSLAHTEEDVEATLDVARKALAAL
jgi:glutamate-1-semialdehyde 2,1-aminomutase